MKDWEERLEEICQNVCVDLGYENDEYIDNIYDIFHEALELDDKSDVYRHKIKEVRKNTLIDLSIDILGISRDGHTLVDRILEEMDVELK